MPIKNNDAMKMFFLFICRLFVLCLNEFLIVATKIYFFTIYNIINPNNLYSCSFVKNVS